MHISHMNLFVAISTVGDNATTSTFRFVSFTDPLLSPLLPTFSGLRRSWSSSHEHGAPWGLTVMWWPTRESERMFYHQTPFEQFLDQLEMLSSLMLSWHGQLPLQIIWIFWWLCYRRSLKHVLSAEHILRLSSSQLTNLRKLLLESDLSYLKNWLSPPEQDCLELMLYASYIGTWRESTSGCITTTGWVSITTTPQLFVIQLVVSLSLLCFSVVKTEAEKIFETTTLLDLLSLSLVCNQCFCCWRIYTLWNPVASSLLFNLELLHCLVSCIDRGVITLWCLVSYISFPCVLLFLALLLFPSYTQDKWSPPLIT